MSDQPYNESRSQQRHDVTMAVDVVDVSRNEVVGRLVNIHTQGLMVMSQGGMKTDHVYQLELRLQQSFKGFDRIRLGVDCLWIRTIDNSATQWVGCHIIDLSEEAHARIQLLMTA